MQNHEYIKHIYSFEGVELWSSIKGKVILSRELLEDKIAIKDWLQKRKDKLSPAMQSAVEFEINNKKWSE